MLKQLSAYINPYKELRIRRRLELSQHEYSYVIAKWKLTKFDHYYRVHIVVCTN